jgi:two-component system, NarL family, response regulator
MTPSPIKILVIEDNLIARLGTVTLLQTQPDFQIVAEVDGGESGLQAYQGLRPDVVLVDLRMPGMDGLAVLRELAKKKPPGRALVLSHYDGDQDVFEAMKAGALGYLSKETNRAALFEAIREIAQGRRYMPQTLAYKLATRVSQPTLTAREQEVLEKIATGKTNPQIAAEMALSSKTVTMYVSHILQKLGVKTRTEAVMAALDKGLLRGD